MKINKRLHNPLTKTLKLSAIVPAISESIIILILLAFSYLNLWLPSTAVAEPRWSSAVTAFGNDKEQVTKKVAVPVGGKIEDYKQEGESCKPKTTSSFKEICCFNKKEKDKEKACKLTTPESGTTTEATCPDNYTLEADLCTEGDKCKLAKEVILYSSITVKVVDPETSRNDWKVSEYMMDALTCDEDENKTCSITSCARGSSFVIKVKDSVDKFVKWTWCKSTSGRSCTVECPKWGDTGSTVTATFEKKCIPQCAGKACGDDSCGGNCGICNNGSMFCNEGICTAPCISNCGIKKCGLDNCNQSCGTCKTGQTCNAVGTCVTTPTTCTPKCGLKNCGDNGCEGNCGFCKTGIVCSREGQCASSGGGGGGGGGVGGGGGGGGGAMVSCCINDNCTLTNLQAGQNCIPCTGTNGCRTTVID